MPGDIARATGLEKASRQRIIVCPLIENEGAYLLCKMPGDRGVFPGQWALSGGGLEPGEDITKGLLREIEEELGDSLVIDSVQPWTFRDDIRVKSYPDVIPRNEDVAYAYASTKCRSSGRQTSRLGT